MSIKGPGLPISLLVARIIVELDEYLFKKLINSSISLYLNISDFVLIYCLQCDSNFWAEACPQCHPIFWAESMPPKSPQIPPMGSSRREQEKER